MMQSPLVRRQDFRSRAAIFAAGLLLGALAALAVAPYRYHEHILGTTYREHRITGRLDRLTYTGWQPVTEWTEEDARAFSELLRR